MIIAHNSQTVQTLKSRVRHLIDQVNKNLKLYSTTGLPAVKAKDLEEFATNPKGFFHKQVMAKAEAQGMEGVNPAEYAKLYDLTFVPITGGYAEADKKTLEFIKLSKGEAVVVDDFDEKTKAAGVIETSTPGQEEAAAQLLKLFSDFAYLSTLLHGAQKIYTTGCQHFGFNPAEPGQLNMNTVNQVAHGFIKLPREEFNKRLEGQVRNPGLNDIHKPKS